MGECKNIPAPPPPPPSPSPPPPALQKSSALSSPPLMRKTPPRSPASPNLSLEGAETSDMMTLIRNKSYRLNKVKSQDVRDWKEESKMETNELMNALRGALRKIGDAAGNTTDDDLIDDDW